LLLQAMMKTGKLDNTLIPELHNEVLEAIKGNNGQRNGFGFYPQGRASVPSEYDFTVQGDTPDHPFSKVGKIYPDMSSVPFGQDGLISAFSKMYQYNQQVNKESLLGLRPPVAKEFGKIHKGGHAGFVDMNLLTAPYRPFVNVAKGLAEEDQFMAMMSKGLSNPRGASNFASNYANNPTLRYYVNGNLVNSTVNALGKVGAGLAIATTPSMAVDRRDRMLYDWASTNRGYPSNLETLGIMGRAGIENAVNGATFGIYDHYVHPEWEPPMEPVQRGYYSDNGQRVPNWVPNLQSTLLSPR